MRYGYYAVAAAAAMCGCTTMSGGANNRRIVPSEVQTLVQCEVEDALRRVATSKPDLKAWGGEYSITLIVERKKGAGLTTLDWVIPHNSNELFLGVGFSASDKKVETTVINGTFRYSKSPNSYCRAYDGENPAFRGQLHIGEWLATVIGDPRMIPSGVGQTLEFIVNVNGGLIPGFDITNLSATAGVVAGRETTHRLVIAFSDKTPSLPQQVVIVGTGDKKVKVETTPPPSGRFLDFLIINNQTRIDR